MQRPLLQQRQLSAIIYPITCSSYSSIILRMIQPAPDQRGAGSSHLVSSSPTPLSTS